MTVKYGTVEYYAEQFSDFLADVQYDHPESGDALVQGFLRSVHYWREYHSNQVDAYNRVEQRVRTSLPM